MLSLLIWPKVIQLSGGHCTTFDFVDFAAAVFQLSAALLAASVALLVAILLLSSLYALFSMIESASYLDLGSTLNSFEVEGLLAVDFLLFSGSTAVGGGLLAGILTASVVLLDL